MGTRRPLPKARALPWAAMNSSRERVPPLRVSVFLFLPPRVSLGWRRHLIGATYVQKRKEISVVPGHEGGWVDGWVRVGGGGGMIGDWGAT